MTYPIHGDLWQSRVECRKFAVMQVCAHPDPPRVTGYWWRQGDLPRMYDLISLPRFLVSMELVERGFEDESREAMP